MPLYEFKCASCKAVFDEVQSINDPPLFYCRFCRGPVLRTFWDWNDKLQEFRRYNSVISQAPILPYFLLSYMVVLLITGLLGGLVYQGVLGFLGIILYSLGISAAGMSGVVPLLGPFLYLLWLGPLMERLIVYHFGLGLTILSSGIFWAGFIFSVIMTIFTSLYLIYRINTPIMWIFLDEDAQERLQFLLVTRLLNYEMTPIWLHPNTMFGGLMARFLGIREFPAIRLRGTTYYHREIPVGPISALERRREQLLKQVTGK